MRRVPRLRCEAVVVIVARQRPSRRIGDEQVLGIPMDRIKRKIAIRKMALLIAGARRLPSTQMGPFIASLPQRIFGWAATAVMAVATVAMFVLR